MKLGIALPHFGPYASPQAIVAVARRAESLGFSSLWVLERLLWPVAPASKYPGNPRGETPGPMRNTYDPLTVLSFVAAHTKKISLGTSVLVAANRSATVTAKMIATLDVLCGGRVIVGLGAGWSADEFVAVGRGIEERLRDLERRLEGERHPGRVERPEPSAGGVQTVHTAQTVVHVDAERAGPPPPVSPTPPTATIPEPAAPSKTREEWEAFVGGKLLNRIGALALILGVGFFLKYAFT